MLLDYRVQIRVKLKIARKIISWVLREKPHTTLFKKEDQFNFFLFTSIYYFKSTLPPLKRSSNSNHTPYWLVWLGRRS